MHPSWKAQLAQEFEKPYFQSLVKFVQEERSHHTVFPPSADVFNAYALPFESVRVVILGQDPYHNHGQAHGLSFSVLPGVKPPPSLQNIFKELKADMGTPISKSGYLASWADQGVFLLNTTLTVRAHEPGSHQGRGWETFTDATIEALCRRADPIVFVLWGKFAKAKAEKIPGQHHILTAPHPSPMSATHGFFGSKPFSKVNALLGDHPINWAI